MAISKKVQAAGPLSAESEKPKVLPQMVKANSSGQFYRDMFVRLPQGMIADDLKEPSIWSKVQVSADALRIHDHLYMVSYDESWAAEAIVAQATHSQVVLCKPRLTTFPERYERLYEDETYRVKWVGSGYAVERKADGRIMTQPVHTAGIAERDLIRQYPVRVL